MRVVVDANVFVSAAIRENSLPFLVVDWVDRHGGLLKSVATERELMDVLRNLAKSVTVERGAINPALDFRSFACYVSIMKSTIKHMKMKVSVPLGRAFSCGFYRFR